MPNAAEEGFGRPFRAVPITVTVVTAPTRLEMGGIRTSRSRGNPHSVYSPTCLIIIFCIASLRRTVPEPGT